jgi:hypothetical protein
MRWRNGCPRDTYLYRVLVEETREYAPLRDVYVVAAENEEEALVQAKRNAYWEWSRKAGDVGALTAQLHEQQRVGE